MIDTKHGNHISQADLLGVGLHGRGVAPKEIDAALAVIKIFRLHLEADRRSQDGI
jgi:hypothetical protein